MGTSYGGLGEVVEWKLPRFTCHVRKKRIKPRESLSAEASQQEAPLLPVMGLPFCSLCTESLTGKEPLCWPMDIKAQYLGALSGGLSVAFSRPPYQKCRINS